MRTVSVPVPHKLPKDEVRARMERRIGGLDKHLPAGATVQSSWPTQDRMALAINAMGQQVDATLDIQDNAVLVTAHLPGMLGMMGGMIENMIHTKGPALIADSRKDSDKNKTD